MKDGRGPMITIYVDGSAALQPGASNRLAHLVDADRELVLVAPAGHPSAGLLAWAGHLPAMPDPPAPGSWFVTADPAICGDRQPSLRTILIAPRSEPRPTRCDVTVRDLRDAILEILAADAMD
jgi:hypothetical protein